MVSIFLIVYLLFCVLVANATKNVAIGFWGVLIMSIFLTPLLSAILLLILTKSRKEEDLEDLDLEEDY